MKSSKFEADIQGLINDLFSPDYITHDYTSMGIPSLIVLSTVFRVDKSYLGNYLAQTLNARPDLVQGKKVLDLGCGCGLLGIICALRGAERVSFSDVNSRAVKNSRLNATLLDVDNTSFSVGSLFDNIQAGDKFDVIVFNPPSITGSPANDAEAALVRQDRVIFNFYEMFPEHLQQGGMVIMPGSSRFDNEMSPLQMVERLALTSQVINTEQEDDGHKKYTISIKPKIA